MRRPNAVVAIGVLLDKLAVLLGADHRPGVAGQRNDRKHAKDGIDGAPLEAKLSQVRPRQQGPRRGNQLGGRGSTRRTRDVSLAVSPSARELRDNRFELQLLRRHTRHCKTVADCSHW
jgi:hypothetical protein